jgi:hypothetical protein
LKPANILLNLGTNDHCVKSKGLGLLGLEKFFKQTYALENKKENIW